MFASQESIIDASRRTTLDSFFIRVCHDACLLISSTSDITSANSDNHATPGIYVWTVHLHDQEDSEYTIYVGRTKSLRRQIQEYQRNFQAHSTNDFKLRVFQRELANRSPTARFCLYFQSAATSSLTASENQAIKILAPMLNKRAKVSNRARRKFQVAFEDYYTAGFQTLFSEHNEAIGLESQKFSLPAQESQ